ncbi:MAG: VOC family protein [Deltaproteobacteria bacterium]|nr:VOC family protein [Deltaproteobacteria bacterium]
MEDQFQHGKFNWCELLTTDVAAAKSFYTKLFGWETEEMSMPGMTYTVIKVGGEGIGGMMGIPESAKGMPPQWGAYVTVDDVDKTAGMVEKLGGKIHVPPTDIPTVGRFCVIIDPQGAFINAITYLKR